MKFFLALGALTTFLAEWVYTVSMSDNAEAIYIVSNIVGSIAWLVLLGLIHMCRIRYSNRSMIFTWVRPLTASFSIFCVISAARMLCNVGVIGYPALKSIQAWIYVLNDVALAIACGYASVYYRKIPQFLDRIARHQVNSRRFDVLTDAAVDGIIELDEYSNIWYANPSAAAIFGFKDVPSILGQNMVDLMPEEYRVPHIAGMKKFIETKEGLIVGNRRPTRVPALRTDGKVITIDLTVSYYMINDVPRFCAIIRDVDETAINGGAVKEKAMCPFTG